MSPGRQRLDPVDEANLVLDRAGQVNVFLVAGLLGTGGFVGREGDPDMAALRRAVAERIALLPELRTTAVPAGRRHVWVEAVPDLEHHVRLVEAVDGLAGLERRCGELMSRPLGLDRPLWELLIVPGAAAGRVGMILRIHHAIADGMAAVEIVRRLFDGAEPSPPSAETHTNRVEARPALERLAYGLRRMRLTVSGREVGRTVLLGQRTPHRGVAFVDGDLTALHERLRSRGVTVNDALLASVASGYRAALPVAGEPIPARLPVSVPVALRRRGSSANQVGVMLVRLPLGEPDPDERLRLIAAQTRAEKGPARDQGTLEFMRGPLGARFMNSIARRQHLVGGFVTNVPGLVNPVSLAGAPVVAIWPVAVLAANVRLGVAAVSYAGRLGCGIHFDAENVPGVEFAKGMAAELTRLGA
ncbi:wax ester/triacylglycerol synthase domain-containing protein [Pseudolysinimonas yzui]|uniref:diacylglycerol O-acyltransferase n=1 Tax=Pseudolysinimonas yzui TaxID=2708254 RepID=A0A8J3M2N3_9MICO|nr:wax ester/triacylglycerol synthase domain-containing protein [Pseudolysinimonas yzui]GHF24334.1 diacylglycerol O-acyltransferase [Pseudolysinimonas yzui]